MRARVVPLLAALVLACFAVQANAAKYPPGPDGPGGACDDTLEIKNLNSAGPCRPGAACVFPSSVGCDSVFGIKGIITAVKDNGSSRTFYIQSRRTNQEYTGLDVFNGTGGLTNPSIQIGDSVSVSGKLEEGFADVAVAESGETEVTGFDAANATSTYADLPVNRLTTGNALPPVKQLNVADIKRVYLPWNSAVALPNLAAGEPWENCLVKVIGPLVVGRRAYTNGGAEATYPGIETRSLGTMVPGGGGFLAYPQGSTVDSIYIDMTSFVTMTPPAVGTVIDSVYGILQGGKTRSGFAGQGQWRIAVRSLPPSYANSATADLYTATAPNVSTAFSVANDSVRIEFDRAVTSGSATIPGHYNLLASERTFDFCRMAGNTGVVCHIDPGSGSWPVGDMEEVSAVSMTGLVNGLTQTDPQLRQFVNGVMPISMIQAPDPDSLSVCIDVSNYSGAGFTNGPRLTFTGVCTAKFGSQYYLQTSTGGARSGVLVFQPGDALTVGRGYIISGSVTEFFGETEVNQPPYVQDLGVGTIPPLFTSTLSVLGNFDCDPSPPPGGNQTLAVTNGEDYEGCLVDFTHNLRAGLSASIAGPGGFFGGFEHPGAGSDSITVDLHDASAYDPDVDDVIHAKGILGYRFGGAQLLTRNDADVTFIGTLEVDPSEIPARVSFAIRPNPARSPQLHFALPKRDVVELSVFDLSGRRLATLARGSFAAGSYSRQWNGRTDRGVMTGAGVYFYRLKVGNETYGLRGVRMN